MALIDEHGRSTRPGEVGELIVGTEDQGIECRSAESIHPKKIDRLTNWFSSLRHSPSGDDATKMTITEVARFLSGDRLRQACPVRGKAVRLVKARSLSSKHIEEVGFRERSLGDSFPADVKMVRPQDDVFNLRI